MEKVCTSCNIEKVLSEFSKSNTGKFGVTSQCKPCKVRVHRVQRRANPEHYLQIERKSKFKKQYGITIEQYDGMLDAQGGGCAVCSAKTPSNRTKYFAVDHCHTTGKVRGLLCTKCNRGLGLFNDKPDLLKSAVNYLLGG